MHFPIFFEVSTFVWIGASASLVFLAVAAVNRIFAGRLSEANPTDWPGKISVLIPARNEEKNIATLLASIEREREIGRLDLEVLVLDDHSTDGTREEVLASPGYGFYVQLVDGKALPPGWTGKNWACHQLALRARGDVFIFIDADVSYTGEALAKSLAFFRDRKISFLSVFPKQILGSRFERMVIPLIDFLLLSFLPLPLVSKLKDPRISAANGQWLVFRAEVYRQIGGHESVRGEILEDMRLASRVKKSGLAMMTLIAGESPECRMYRSASEVWSGLSKNAFALLGGNFLFPFVWSTLFFLDILPWLLLVFGVWGAVPWILLRLTTRALTSFRSGPHVLLHPVSMGLFLVIALNSLVWKIRGRASWKGRDVLLSPNP